MARVSVVIPSYNHERFVAEAVRSALDQSFRDLEVVVADDGSTDRTAEVVEGITDPRLRFFPLEHRGAQFATRKCLAEATGEYVAMLSSDDAFLPGKIEEQVRFLDEHAEVLAVFGFPRFVDEDGVEIAGDPRTDWFRQPNRSRFEWLRLFFFEGNRICHPTILARRACYETVGPPDPRLSLTSDYRRWIRTCMRHEIHVLPREVLRFRVLRTERNASGLRPAVRRRFQFEMTKVLREYLDLSPEDLLRVFPEAKSLCREVRRELVPYLVAQMALRSEELRPSSLLFAMDVLYDALGDPDTARLLESECGFRHRDFVELTGSYDPAPRELRDRLDQILRSRSWRLTEPFRAMMSLLRGRPEGQTS